MHALHQRSCLALLFAASLAGAPDLKRITPVPDGEPIPTVDFFRPDLCYDPSLSPDGAHIAARTTEGSEEQSLIVYDTKTKIIDKLSPYQDQDIYWYTWLGDQRLACSIGARRYWSLGLYSTDLGNLGAPRALLVGWPFHFVSAPARDRTKPLVWVQVPSNVRPDDGVKVIDSSLPGDWAYDRAATDRSHAPSEQNYRHVLRAFPVPAKGVGEAYICDKDGELEYAIYTLDGVKQLYRLDGDKWAACPVDLDQIDIIGPGNAPGQLVVAVRQSGAPSTLQFMDGATGKLGEVLFQDAEYDFDGWLLRDPRTRLVSGVQYNRNGPKVVWFDAEMRSLQEKFHSTFPAGEFVSIVSQSEVGHRYVTRRLSDRQAPIYDWIDIDAHSAALFRSTRPWLDPKRMQPTQVLRFKTPDGKALDAYLTLPGGTTKEHPAPLIVLSLDAAETINNPERVTWGMDSVTQFLVSRGYAVLRPNHRGSRGYAWKFPLADRWDLMKMRGDFIAATEAVCRTKLVNPGAVVAMGKEFGAYLALGAAEDAPNLFRGVVGIDGMYDWERYAVDFREMEATSWLYGWIKHRLGDPSKDGDRLAALSPARHTDKLQAPVLVAYDESNSTEWITQSHRLVAALNRTHTPVEIAQLAEAHVGPDLQQRIDQWDRIEAFLRRIVGDKR